MKKAFLILLSVFALMFTSCYKNSAQKVQESFNCNIEDITDFRMIAEQGSYRVFVEMNTGILYYHYSNQQCVFMIMLNNADGSPKTIYQIPHGKDIFNLLRSK